MRSAAADRRLLLLLLVALLLLGDGDAMAVADLAERGGDKMDVIVVGCSAAMKISFPTQPGYATTLFKTEQIKNPIKKFRELMTGEKNVGGKFLVS